jgi:CBS domain-containing protein
LITEFIVHDGNRATGYLPAARLWSALRSPGGRESTAAQAALPLGDPVAENAPLTDALEQLDRDRCDAAPVVDDEGVIVGVITRTALSRAQSIARHLADRDRSS